MKTRYYLIAACLILAALLAYAVAYPSLPPRIATHWNIHGEVDAYGTPFAMLELGPGLMTLVALIFAVLPWLSPRRFALDTFEKTYLQLMLIAVALPGYLFVVMLWSALGQPTDMAKALIGGICLFTIAIGNLLGKVRRNFFIGIRTPWTLASERTWYATHRFAGKSIVATSAVAAVAMLAGAPGWIAIALLLLGFLAPIVYSLLYFRRNEGTGEANGA